MESREGREGCKEREKEKNRQNNESKAYISERGGRVQWRGGKREQKDQYVSCTGKDFT